MYCARPGLTFGNRPLKLAGTANRRLRGQESTRWNFSVLASCPPDLLFQSPNVVGGRAYFAGFASVGRSIVNVQVPSAEQAATPRRTILAG